MNKIVEERVKVLRPLSWEKTRQRAQTANVWEVFWAHDKIWIVLFLHQGIEWKIDGSYVWKRKIESVFESYERFKVENYLLPALNGGESTDIQGEENIMLNLRKVDYFWWNRPHFLGIHIEGVSFRGLGLVKVRAIIIHHGNYACGCTQFLLLAICRAAVKQRLNLCHSIFVGPKSGSTTDKLKNKKKSSICYCMFNKL